MTTRTIATTIILENFGGPDGTTGSVRRAVSDGLYHIGVEGVWRGGIAPYLVTLTLVAGLLVVWAGLCSI
jgi:hypothetical protein